MVVLSAILLFKNAELPWGRAMETAAYLLYILVVIVSI